MCGARVSGTLRPGLVRERIPSGNKKMKVKPEQYWVINPKGTVIYRTVKRLEATTFASIFQRGCEVLAVARLPK